MTDTPRLGITQLEEDQALPEVVVNEGTRILEAFGNATHFKSRTTTAQPGSPSDGDVYLLPGSSTGTDWAGHDGEIAIFINTGWVFRDAKEGFIAWVDDTDDLIAFDGTNWIDVNATPDLDDIGDVNAPSPTVGQVLTWDDTPGEWVAADLPAAGSFVLDDATDVNAPSPTAGQVLTWDDTPGEWVAAAPGATSNGKVFLAEQVASASAQLDFTGFVSATYDEYEFEIVDIVMATDNVNLLMRMSTNGGSSYAAGASDYAYALNQSTNAFSGGVGSNGTTSIDVSGGIDNAANNSVNGSAKLFKPGGSGHKNVTFQTSGIKNDNNFYAVTGAGRYKSTTAVDAIRFLASSGNITSGVIRVYGIAKA
jgi:hypothetical protein